MAELFCPQHGPYDASYGTCPFCGGGKRPQAPRPLGGGDDMPTDLGAAQPPTVKAPRPAQLNYDEMSTDLGGGRQAAYSSGGGMGEDETPTELPRRHSGGGRFLDADDEEVTSLPKGGRDGIDITELDSVPTGQLGLLWVKEGHRRGQTYRIKDGDVVGRQDTNPVSMVLDDPKISNPHAKFTVEDDQFVIWDFGSRNGTYVNGERIRAATPLKENDVIKMGDTIVVLKVLNVS